MSRILSGGKGQRFILMLCFFSAVSNSSTPTDSAVLASAIKNGKSMLNWFLPKNKTINLEYATACSYYGVCIFSEAIQDTSFLNATATRYKALGNNPGKTGHVDNNVHGILPLDLYRQTKTSQFKTAGLRLANDEFSSANLRSDTLTKYSRFWVDDMYMIGSLQAQAYKSTDSMRYLNNAARTLYYYIDSLQQGNGLFYHAPCAGARYYWGRGNGWAASSMTELLLVLPYNHPRREYVMDAYVKQMNALIKYQDTDIGMWHQLLDDQATFQESSCTAMFIFALATGLKQGWLAGDSIELAVKKGWMALASCFDAANGLKYVCTGLGATSNRSEYLNHEQKTGDSHGTAGFIWAATAVVRLFAKPPTMVMPHSLLRGLSIQKKEHHSTHLFDLRGRNLGDLRNSAIEPPGSGIYIKAHTTAKVKVIDF